MAEEGGGEELLELESSKSENVEVVKEGVASIALLPSGSISGHFIQLPHSICYGLHGSELPCERECSRGEDYRLIKLTIVDFNSGKEQVVVVECKGHDAARFHNIDQAHGWEKDTVGMVEEKHGKKKIHISFECETLKADKAAEDHIKKFMPKLAGLDAVVNIGRMSISGLDFEAEDAELACERECSRGEDYRLIKLTIVDFNSGKEQVVVVECKSHDAARFHNIDQAHGWEKDTVGMVEEKHGKKKIHVSFECETLKADKAAEDHIKKFMPKLAGLDAVVNIGRMSISGLDFEAEDAGVKQNMIQ